MNRGHGILALLEAHRARANEVTCGLIRLVMAHAPKEARAIFSKVEANDRRITKLTKSL